MAGQARREPRDLAKEKRGWLGPPGLPEQEGHAASSVKGYPTRWLRRATPLLKATRAGKRGGRWKAGPGTRAASGRGASVTALQRLPAAAPCPSEPPGPQPTPRPWTRLSDSSWISCLGTVAAPRFSPAPRWPRRLSGPLAHLLTQQSPPALALAPGGVRTRRVRSGHQSDLCFSVPTPPHKRPASV